MPQGNGVSSTIRSANGPPSSAEGGEEDFASAEARRWLSDRPRHPFGSLTYKLVSYQRRQVAAALSAAVTTTNLQETAPNLQRHIVWKKNHLEPQLLFGRGGLGERRFS